MFTNHEFHMLTCMKPQSASTVHLRENLKVDLYALSETFMALLIIIDPPMVCAILEVNSEINDFALRKI